MSTGSAKQCKRFSQTHCTVWHCRRCVFWTHFVETFVHFVDTLEGLCIEAIFSSLFQPQFRAHKAGRKIAEAASGHCHNSHTWLFGQEEVQLREFVSTLHVTPETWPRTSLMSILSLAPPPSPTARLLWHLQRALHQAACHATACARCLNIV